MASAWLYLVLTWLFLGITDTVQYDWKTANRPRISIILKVEDDCRKIAVTVLSGAVQCSPSLHHHGLQHQPGVTITIASEGAPVGVGALGAPLSARNSSLPLGALPSQSKPDHSVEFCLCCFSMVRSCSHWKSTFCQSIHRSVCRHCALVYSSGKAEYYRAFFLPKAVLCSNLLTKEIPRSLGT